MSTRNQNVFGYGVAALGFGLVIASMVFIGRGMVAEMWVNMTLIAVGCLLIAMGMYVVLPKETEGAIDQVGEVIDKLPFPRLQQQRNGEPPAILRPAENQPAIVVPPAGEPVVITPTGEAKPVTRAEDIALLEGEDPGATQESPHGERGP